VDVDWIDGRPGEPVLLAVHGFEGSSQSAYVRRLAGAARERGWSVACLNLRGCSGEPNRLPGSYHSGFTEDLDLLASSVAARSEGRPLLVAGFSMGGNIVGRWLGRHADRVPATVAGAALICVPFDLGRAADSIQTGFNRIYRWNFLRTLRPRALVKARLHPGIFDEQAIRRARSIRDYDDAVTSPAFGFAGAADYYARATCRGELGRVRVPTLALVAGDDPMVPADSAPTAAELRGGSVRVITAPCGGHLAFVAGDRPGWLERQILRWLETSLAELRSCSRA
jgi:predicted alpha/beta-fold hydrolase